MRFPLSRWPFQHHGLAAGMVLALLALAFVGPLMLLAHCSSGQQTSLDHTCWSLTLGSFIPIMVVFAWLLQASRGVLAREYPFPLLRPPRLLLS